MIGRRRLAVPRPLAGARCRGGEWGKLTGSSSPMDKDAEDGRNGWAPSGQCTVFACDIISFASRPDSVQRHLRTVLYDLLERSFTASGLPFSEFHREDRGDGLIAVLRPGHDGARLVHPLPDHLRAELRRSNELAKEIAQIRLRVALHLGRMDSDANGIVGDTVNHVNAAPGRPVLQAGPRRHRGRPRGARLRRVLPLGDQGGGRGDRPHRVRPPRRPAQGDPDHRLAQHPRLRPGPAAGPGSGTPVPAPARSGAGALARPSAGARRHALALARRVRRAVRAARDAVRDAARALAGRSGDAPARGGKPFRRCSRSWRG